MLSKLDLQMFKILDEYVDKELKFGCIFIRGDDSIAKVLFNKPFAYGYELEDEVIVCEGSLNKPLADIPKEILGQIHLGTILQWLGAKNSVRMKYYIGLGTEKVYMVVKENDMIKFELNTTKPPLERTDEQKQKFIDFALSVKG